MLALASHLQNSICQYAKIRPFQGCVTMMPRFSTHCKSSLCPVTIFNAALRKKASASSFLVLLQITEAVAALVASLKGDSQGNATQALLEPIIRPLQAHLQQAQQHGAGPGQQAPDNVEYVGALLDRLSTVFK